MAEDRPFVWGRHETGEKVHGIPEVEYHVLIGLCNLYPADVIAAKMGISYNTVRFHRSRLLARLDSDSTEKAIREAWRRQILRACPTCRRYRDDEAPVAEPEEIKVPPRARDVKGTKLTKRMSQVLRMCAKGMSNAEIGKALGVSEITVKSHARLLFSQLGAKDRANAVAIGYELGLLKIGDTPH